jgi:hypothetical protein
MASGRVPGTRAGLKSRSQSAQDAPAPAPVANAIGHVRPARTGQDERGGARDGGRWTHAGRG